MGKNIQKYYKLSVSHLAIYLIGFAVIGGVFILLSFASNPNLIGDENNDGVVNILDLSMLLSNWHATNAAVDLTGDGYVDILDLSVLLSHWGQTGSGNTPSPFVSVCGTGLCLGGSPFVIHGATAYGTYSSPSNEVSLAQAGKVNTLELVEFDTQYHTLSDTMSTATWTRVDNFIAAAKQAGLHVILNLSEYGQSLQAAGQTPTTTDWQPYLSFIANRTNTVTGVRYMNDPTIAMVEIFGEICYPGESDSVCPAGTTGTAADMQNFFHRTETEWQALAPNILISTGGFSHLNNSTSSGIPWQTIVSDSSDAVCDIEINSPNDITGAIGKFTSYCLQQHKPWFLSAWSSCYQDTGYPYYLATDAAMASHAQDMYNIQHGGTPAAMPAVGSDFWNLRDIGVSAGHCDLGPAYSQTWATIQNNAP